MKCEECCKEQGCLLCTDCEQLLCNACEQFLHRGGKRRSHARIPACCECGLGASFECQDCLVKLCSGCQGLHLGHRIAHVSMAKCLGVFWDVSLISSQDFSVSEVVKEISVRIAKPKFVKLYTDGWSLEKIDLKCELIRRFRMSPLDALFLDISVLASSGLTHILIITPNFLEIRNRVVHLKSPTLKIFLASKQAPLEYLHLPTKLKIRRLRHKSFSHACGELTLHPDTSQVMKIVFEVLAEEAQFGKILVEKSELVEKVSNKLRCSFEHCCKLLNVARDLRIVNQISMKINELNLVFYSVRVSQISPDIMEWVLNSLKSEEITPTKQVIKTRLSKVFNLYIPNSSWKSINRTLTLHKKSLSDVLDKTKVQKKSSKIFKAGEQWKGLDSIKGDPFEVRKLECWDEFLEFCEDYFSKHFKQSISMGRFGLALLVKYTGPDSLKFLSTGKIMYLINLAISEDLLRYKYPNLYWSKDFKVLDNGLYGKLNEVKGCILKLLAKAPIRLSAVKPLLKEKFNIDLQLKDFGYKKLKELLLSVPDIELDLDFVKLRPSSQLDSEKISDLIFDIIKDKEYGIPESVLEATLQARLNHSIDWSHYNVSSCLSFIQQYSRHSIEILKTQNCNILFKSNELKTYSYFFPFKSNFHSAVLESSRLTPQTYHPVSISFDFQSSVNKVQHPMQRFINISNIPSDIVQKSPFRDEETPDDRFLEPFAADISNVIENSSAGGRSIQHSKNSSICNLHYRAQSTNLIPEMRHSRFNFSWIDKPYGLE